MARNDRLQITQRTEDDAVHLAGNRIFGGVFKKAFRVVNHDRAVVIILDPYCVRWMGYARGIEVSSLGKKPARGWDQINLGTGTSAPDPDADGWTAVNGRHEFLNGDEGKCIRNALRWVNHTASWIYAR